MIAKALSFFCVQRRQAEWGVLSHNAKKYSYINMIWRSKAPFNPYASLARSLLMLTFKD
jgi:hypothetical protein